MSKIFCTNKGCDYQADVCLEISNTIKQTYVGKSQILWSRRREFRVWIGA